MKFLFLILSIFVILITCEDTTVSQNSLCTSIIQSVNAARIKKSHSSLKISKFLDDFALKQAQKQANKKCIAVSTKEDLDALKVNMYGENVGFLKKQTKLTIEQQGSKLISKWFFNPHSKSHKKIC